MNILHLTHTDIAYDSRILKEIESLSKSPEPYVVSGIGVARSAGACLSESSESMDIEAVTLISSKLRFMPRLLMHIFSVIEITVKIFFKALCRKPAAIHCHDTVVLPVGVLLKLFTRAKLIYDAHELESNRVGHSAWSGRLTLTAERIFWPLIDALVVVSPQIESWYKEHLGDKLSIVVLNSPIISKKGISLKEDYFRHKFSIPRTSKVFLYLGLLSEGRAIKAIADAFLMDGTSSHVVFMGYGNLKEELVDMEARFERIHVHPPVPHEEVVSYAQFADVGLCLIQNTSLSHFYSLPNKLFEYAFAGIPVLASNFPSISEIVKKYGLGKCCELATIDIQKSIRSFEKEGESVVSPEKIIHELGWSAQEKKLAQLYQEVLS